MRDLFNKVGKLAKDTAEKAVDKTGELVEVGKLKAQISSAKSEIGTAKKQIGDYYYKKYGESVELDSEVIELCKIIKEQESLIDELEAKIELVK